MSGSGGVLCVPEWPWPLGLGLVVEAPPGTGGGREVSPQSLMIQNLNSKMMKFPADENFLGSAGPGRQPRPPGAPAAWML